MRPLSALIVRVCPRLGRFRRNSDGSTAVEFALVAVPFFALVFAIIETALVFFAGQVLESGVSDASRLVRTGQAQQMGMDEAAFRNRICERSVGLLNCGDSLKVDVRTYNNFGAINLASPVDEDGNLDDNFTFELGQGGDIVMVRAFYEWPTIVPGFGINMANLGNGKRLLAGAATFRNEPF
jgi:Flp pilus assembly protein TadG